MTLDSTCAFCSGPLYPLNVDEPSNLPNVQTNSKRRHPETDADIAYVGSEDDADSESGDDRGSESEA